MGFIQHVVTKILQCFLALLYNQIQVNHVKDKAICAEVKPESAKVELWRQD